MIQVNTQATAITRARYNHIAPVYGWIEAISESSLKAWREKLWSWAQGRNAAQVTHPSQN